VDYRALKNPLWWTDTSPTDLGDAWQTVRSLDLHETGPQERLSPYPNQRRWQVQTAFRTAYGQFKYRVTPFGLTNAPAPFQAYLDDRLQPYIVDLAVCYFDDILIYSINEEDHEEQVRTVLEERRDFGLYSNTEMCRLGVAVVSFLGFVISPDWIAMESDHTSTIEDWPTPESVWDIHVLPGFTNLYPWFSRNHAMVTTPISYLLKKGENSRTSEWDKWESAWDAELAFRKLNSAVTDPPVLNHLDLAKLIILQTDARGFPIAGILNQYDGFRILRQVDFYPRRCTDAEQNCDTYDRQLLSIVQTMK